MTTTVPSSKLSAERCKVCDEQSFSFGELKLLKKYQVQYFRCERCGFVQTESPYWLDESYSSAIASQDVGIMQRNIMNVQVTSAVLNLLFPEFSSGVDFGAGHGVLVRLMRDRGFNFFWYDLHASNDYARGFEYQQGSTLDFLTAFEVLEHFVNPVSDLSTLMELSDNVFVSTTTLPHPAPRPSEWWYYAPGSGQHVSFYTTESLRLLAARFGRTLLSVGSYHLFTRISKSAILYRLATHYRIARIINAMYKRPSLTESDLRQMTG